MTDWDNFDGCSRDCRSKGRHTMEYGRCSHADKPEPTVSMSKVYTAADGYPTIGYDQYTVQQLADLIEPALRRVQVRFGPNALAMLQRGETVGLSGGEYADLAREAAYAIVHRSDEATNCTHDAERHGPEAGCIECRCSSTTGHAAKMMLPCNWARTRTEHGPHDWEPQPGMNPVHCPGWTKAAEARAAAFREAAAIADDAVALFEDDEESAVAAGAMEGIADHFRSIAASGPEADERIVAYRAPGLDILYCTDCRPQSSFLMVPVESADLPDGGICENCDRDLLIQPVRTDTEIIEAAREIGLAAPEDAPRVVAAAREFLAQSGISTPGCDCGHDGMGAHWHLKSCTWMKTLNVPHPDRIAGEPS